MATLKHLVCGATLAAALALALAGAAWAAPSANQSAAAANGAEKYLAGLDLIDQDARRVDLYRDLVAGHSVVIYSFFATCTDSCPTTVMTLKEAHSRLGNRLGQDVRFVAVTVDPARDTPKALKAYAKQIKAPAGWVFLTGTDKQVGAALRRIGMFVEEPADHMDLMVVGNTNTGLWKKIHGSAPSGQVVDLIVGVADDPVR
jgi:cytochrome oxidase Cu insertion factor (SCO1/SenC/PrrC family)